MELAGREYQTLQTAIAALQATAGLKTVTVDVRPLAIDQPNPRADAVLTELQSLWVIESLTPHPSLTISAVSMHF
jgi:hypothetical protein